jgi:CRISPR/Cas system CMR subunit Cmr6 (Cas7 group RAMP superfamily)
MMAKGFLPLLHAGDYVIITINSICAVARYGHFQSKKRETNPFFSLCRRILSMIGMPKAKVFPVPVRARPIMSFPCIAGSRTALCAEAQGKTITARTKN